jgi:xanthine dehydrogenase small subunit
MLNRFASPQIRNRATLGGNIANASPIADWPPVLLALDAELQIADAGGGSRRLRIADFYRSYRQTDLADAEYLHSVSLPEASDWDALYIHKVSKRHEDDISTVLGAFYLGQTEGRLTDVRIAFGGMAAVPLRVAAVEDLLQNTAIDNLPVEQAADALAAELRPISDVRASADYRKAVAGELLRAALRSVASGDARSPEHGALEHVAAT